MLSLVDGFLRWWLRTGRYQWSRLHRRFFEVRYLATALPEVHSLEEIEAALGQLTWQADGLPYLFDCISYPQTTWYKKKDDCDGFACVAAALLERWRPDSKPVLLTVTVQPVRASHTVCLFNLPDGLAVFDNGLLRRDCYTPTEVVTSISQSAKRLVCWDVRDPSSLKMIEFHKA